MADSMHDCTYKYSVILVFGKQLCYHVYKLAFDHHQHNFTGGVLFSLLN
jgi:hypothetical protein